MILHMVTNTSNAHKYEHLLTDLLILKSTYGCKYKQMQKWSAKYDGTHKYKHCQIDLLIMIVHMATNVRPKINICVFTVTCQKNLGSVGLDYFFFFFIIDKTGNSRSRFRYLIFENSGKMTNYAVFLPSLISISTKS
jgi:hypothetical protein